MTIRTVNTIEEMQRLSAEWRVERLTVALVPTMGYLHEGHRQLIRSARSNADRTVASVFVNPTQFGPDEDYEDYPRDTGHDKAVCQEEGVDAMFMPSAREMYAADHSTWVVEESLSQSLCGKFRPGHFKGVVTVVTKLFHAVQPDVTVFGQKDAQQAFIIQRLIRDLNFGIRLVVAPTAREKDGLALSCRNEYLSADERLRATSIYRGLKYAEQAFNNGERNSPKLADIVKTSIEDSGGEVEYVELVHTNDFQPVDSVNDQALLAVAAYFGQTRLIDNTILNPESTKNG